ncbi:PAS domain S-box protein [Microvirga terrae]|uniref:histidine kinase n=1 Tax=Microvirga terrae TaxID=2740529 RepID=A0ABY5RTH6_9HYPH|nr:histidine kinase dimerization/phosphoacceptor domain -containing protein [Microvirga terrae]UVF20560.1 PAS domain S-box protein [Microvirga terrae]
MLAETHVAPSDSQEASFRAAFHSLRVPVLMVDPSRTPAPVVFANPAFFDLTGHSPDEVLGRGWHLLQAPDAGPASFSAIDAALRRGEALETAFRGRRTDGSPFWSTLSLSPVHDEAGQLRSVTVLLNGAGATKPPDRDRFDAGTLLDEKAERRIQDLRLALEQKTALLHEVEHRAKNSLQMIASLVLLKARRLQDPEARKVLQDLAERVGALAAAHRLLHGAGDTTRFNLKEFATELAGDLAATLPKGQVDLDLQAEPLGVPAAKAAALALLLNEVVGNAVKHAFPNGRRGRLTIAIERVENGVQIAVEDDGVGLDHSPPPEGSFGKTLITMLVHQLKGRLTWHDREPGTRAEIVIPVDAEETRFE